MSVVNVFAERFCLKVNRVTDRYCLTFVWKPSLLVVVLVLRRLETEI